MNISGLRLPARRTGAAAGAKRGSFDLPFFVLTLLLLAIGVIMVLSSSFARAYAQGKSPTYYFVRQAGFAVAGVVGMILFSNVRMATYRRWSLLLLGVSIFLLAIVWIPHIGVVGGGARRWLSLGFTTFQPSEIAKIAVVLFFSSMICTYKDQMQTIRYGVVPFMVITGGIVILLMLEPHLSASIIIMALAIVMMFVGGIKLSYLLIGMGGAGALLLTSEGEGPYVTHVTTGRIRDAGVTDANNMGAAMAPAAYETLRAHFADTGRTPADYAAIITGDLGKIGHEILTDLFLRDGVDLGVCSTDCGMLIFNPETQDVHAGGSGCGCSASVLCGHILQRMTCGDWPRVLFAATGALMSPTTSQQGESIPGICHAVVLDVDRG